LDVKLAENQIEIEELKKAMVIKIDLVNEQNKTIETIQ